MNKEVVSIVICTCNRSEHLRQTLVSLATVRVPEEIPAELIVVDNGSTDDTAEVVRQCRLPNMEVRYILESQRGQCHARNAGVAAAQGEIILFTDDDLRFSPDWIAGMCEPILSGQAEAVAGGVALAPHLRRSWMTQEHQSWLASTASIAQEEQPRMVGANMAFSRKVLEKVPQFDTDLGPGALGFDDDTLFAWQLLQAGFRVELALDVCVEHHFEPSRLLRQNFLSSARKMGCSWAYVVYHWRQDSPPMKPRHYLKPVLRLFLWRVRNAASWHEPEGIAETELLLLQRYWFVKQYRREQRKPRHYTRHGLRKIIQ